jgi:Uncharacterized conserved protein
MKFKHKFDVNAPVAVVAEFHRNPNNLVALTPFPVRVRIVSAPSRINEGEEIEFHVWLGPIPIRWLARIVQLDENGFTDVQVRGPFRHWIHRHRFVPQAENKTLIIDEIEAELSWHPIHFTLGFFMWLGLPLLFAYRRKVTQRLI